MRGPSLVRQYEEKAIPVPSTTNQSRTQKEKDQLLRSFSKSPELQLREAEKGASVAAGGDGGLFRLRWPDGCLEVAETAGISPAGVGSSLGFSRGRVWSPDAVGEDRKSVV